MHPHLRYLYNEYVRGLGAFVIAATPGPLRDEARATPEPPGTHWALPRATQEPLRTAKGSPRAARRAPGAATRAPREPQEAPGGLPDPQKTMKNAVLSTKFGFSAERDFRAAQRAPRAAREAPRAPQGPPRSAPGRPKGGPRAAKSCQERPRGLRGGPGQAHE